MTDRERLTKHWGNNCVATKLDYDFVSDMPDEYFKEFEAIIKKLAEYEDLEEKGKLIVPPCKVGDKMYCDGKYFASHCAGEIMEFTVDSVKTSVRNIFRGEIDVQFDFDDFGKIVFLTPEEAEKALAEREGGTNAGNS